MQKLLLTLFKCFLIFVVLFSCLLSWQLAARNPSDMYSRRMPRTQTQLKRSFLVVHSLVGYDYKPKVLGECPEIYAAKLFVCLHGVSFAYIFSGWSRSPFSPTINILQFHFRSTKYFHILTSCPEI